MITRLLAAAVAGGVAMFAFGFLIYGLVLDPMLMRPNMNVYPGLVNDPPMFVPLALGNLVSGFLLAYIYEKWAGIRTFATGAQAGAIIWFLFALSVQLMFIAFMNLSKNYIPPISDVIGSTVLGGISGGVVGFVLGVMHKPAAE
ncbi:MAG TPA: hypothetical protein PKO33_10230 [Pyrinomonadaceae bacterium]|nr:hypothetical protein [Pyrinomonadaceae bacterium]